MHTYRTHTCAALRKEDAGKQVRLSGWIHSKRDHGNLLFIDLRDHYGLTQCVVDTSSPCFAKLEKIRPGIRADIDFCFASSPLTIRDFYGTKEGALYGYNRDCKNMALSQLPVATKVRNLLLTGQNINLHGICGVPLTAIETVESIVGRGSIVKKINEEYDRRNEI